MKWKLDGRILVVDGSNHTLRRNYTVEEITRAATTRGSVELTNNEFFVFEPFLKDTDTNIKVKTDRLHWEYDFGNWQINGNDANGSDNTRVIEKRVKFFKRGTGGANVVDGEAIEMNGDNAILENNTEYVAVSVHNEKNPNGNNGYVVATTFTTKDGIIDTVANTGFAKRLVNGNRTPDAIYALITETSMNDGSQLSGNNNYVFKKRNDTPVDLPLLGSAHRS